MKFIKDKLLIFILLTGLLQLYIIMTRGDWETSVEQKGADMDNNNRLVLTDDLFIESEHSISPATRTIGSHTYFVTDKCFTVDSLEIAISETYNDKEILCKKVKTRIADINELQFDSLGGIKEESLLKNEKIKICPGQRIEISNWFEYPNNEASEFKIRYFIITTDKQKILGQADLIKKTSFEINGRHHYDFIILLYPVLWGLLGLLILIKVIRVVQKK
jgi:hypothetical protein